MSTLQRRPRADLTQLDGDPKYDHDPALRKFKRKLYHASIAEILKSLRKGTTVPVVRRCLGGHYRPVIYDLASFIADYSEQVTLAGIVQNWCPKCNTAVNKDLNGPARLRTQHFTEMLLNPDIDGTTLWDSYGVGNDCSMVQGTFKDHLVTWVGEYLHLKHGKAKANEVLDDIDRRTAEVSPWPLVQQCTGDDSKALMKVYLSAIHGRTPDEMVQAIAAFLGFYYLAKRADITEDTLALMEQARQ